MVDASEHLINKPSILFIRNSYLHWMTSWTMFTVPVEDHMIKYHNGREIRLLKFNNQYQQLTIISRKARDHCCIYVCVIEIN